MMLRAVSPYAQPMSPFRFASGDTTKENSAADHSSKQLAVSDTFMRMNGVPSKSDLAPSEPLCCQTEPSAMEMSMTFFDVPQNTTNAAMSGEPSLSQIHPATMQELAHNLAFLGAQLLQTVQAANAALPVQTPNVSVPAQLTVDAVV
ncbi:MAG: hypothetical protein KTR14_00245 [Vampirovibrio sp.]|nr:hypothetical protein [Vampirovibrio sp.]